jgi:hypothetical protein
MGGEKWSDDNSSFVPDPKVLGEFRFVNTNTINTNFREFPFLSINFANSVHLFKHPALLMDRTGNDENV